MQKFENIINKLYNKSLKIAKVFFITTTTISFFYYTFKIYLEPQYLGKFMLNFGRILYISITSFILMKKAFSQPVTSLKVYFFWFLIVTNSIIVLIFLDHFLNQSLNLK